MIIVWTYGAIDQTAFGVGVWNWSASVAAPDEAPIITRRITLIGNDERRISLLGNDERRLTFVGN